MWKAVVFSSSLADGTVVVELTHTPRPPRMLSKSSRIQRPQIQRLSTGALLLPPHSDFSLQCGIHEELYRSRHACCSKKSRSNHKIVADCWLVWALRFQQSHRSRADKNARLFKHICLCFCCLGILTNISIRIFYLLMVLRSFTACVEPTGSIKEQV